MKQLIVPAITAAIVLVGVFVWTISQPATAEESEAVIAAQVTQYLDLTEDERAAGEPCVISLTETAHDGLSVFNIPTRLAVTDQTGEIVAVTPIAGEILVNDAGTFRCVAQLSLPVPDRPFYSLVLGDITLATFSRTDLPFTPETQPEILIPSGR